MMRYLQRLLPGRREEAVDVAFLNAVVVRVELALDGVKLAGASGPCDKVDAGIGFADFELIGDIGKHPDVAVEVRIRRLVAQVQADEFFEVGAFFTFRDGGVAEVGEQVL